MALRRQALQRGGDGNQEQQPVHGGVDLPRAPPTGRGAPGAGGSPRRRWGHTVGIREFSRVRQRAAGREHNGLMEASPFPALGAALAAAVKGRSVRLQSDRPEGRTGLLHRLDGRGRDVVELCSSARASAT